MSLPETKHEAPVPTAAADGKPEDRPHPGKVGFVILLLVALPPLVYYLWICATFYDGALQFPTSMSELQSLLDHVPAPTALSVLIFGSWFLGQVALQELAPGYMQEGTPLADGTRLKYKMNGLFSYCVSLVVVFLLAALRWVRPAILYDEFGPLLSTVNTFAFLFSLYLFLDGRFGSNPEKAKANVFYDYFMGTRLNPRIGNLDLKCFCELRPGLIGWVVINFSLAAKQYELHGTVTWPMILVVTFHFFYIADCFWHEEALLTTWDIKHERFGWMLCWGDLVWVPFTYTLQALYLVHHPHELPIWGIAAIVLLNMAGYGIFRGANIQKHRFRNNPDRPIWGKPPEYITTKHGTRLLTSGWWGIARHANYLGDLMMGLAWCLPCLFAHPLPYFYFVYFLILLVHRERRDNDKCQEKYGADWDKYCQKVRWRILPGVY